MNPILSLTVLWVLHMSLESLTEDLECKVDLILHGCAVTDRSNTVVPALLLGVILFIYGMSCPGFHGYRESEFLLPKHSLLQMLGTLGNTSYPDFVM